MASLMSIGLPPKPAACLLSASLPLLVLSESRSSHTGHFFFKTVSSLAFLGGPLLRASQSHSPYAIRMAAGFVFSLIGDILLVPARKDYYAETDSTGQTDNNNNSDKPTEQNVSSTYKISKSFRLGVVAFAAAHAAYVLAFLSDAESISWPKFVTTLVANTVLSKFLGVIYPSENKDSSWSVGNLLNLSISSDMKPLTTAYAIIIGSMMAAATAVQPRAGSESLQQQRLLGAAMFVASDVFVAKDTFGRKGTAEKKQPGQGKKQRHWLFLTVGWGLYFWGQMILAGTVQ
ncbi:hypothetical protein AJ80_01956 [Polytolypa hystricis UAMH7299]|uniref:YhhN domain-containing protein n=1 Tax=Polytolypa hystricis (strain UAMH7299) TaxID=1447883 RepID=A0A2B7YIG8_POLH7|nr:hypothetical protein AJ80_01956 [Polytolypa hystricis UAMH7299]